MHEIGRGRERGKGIELYRVCSTLRLTGLDLPALDWIGLDWTRNDDDDDDGK